MILFLKKCKIVEKALFIYAGLCCLATIIKMLDILHFPFSAEYGESTILYQVKLLFEGNFPYTKRLVDIHNYFSYTPLFQYLVSWLGTEPGNWLTSARVLNSFCLIAVGILISIIFYQDKGEHKKPAHFILTLLLWLSWYPVFNWMGLARLDGLALFLQVLGLYFYLRTDRRNIYQVLAMLSLVLAFFSKQTAVWVAAGLVVNDLYNRKINPFWIIYFIGVGVGVALFNLKSDGTLWMHLVGSNQNVFHLELLIENLRANVVFHLGLLLIALFGLYKIEDTKQNVLTVILLIMSIPIVIGIGREGSNVNFLLELCVPLTWLLMIGSEKLDRSVAGAFVGVLLVFSMPGNLQFRWNFLNSKSEQGWSSYSPAAAESSYKLVQIIKNQSGEVWSEDISLPIFAGKDPTFFPFEYMQGISRGTIDEGPLLEKIQNKKIALIIVENRAFRPYAKRFTDRMGAAITTNYHVQLQDDYFYVYLPNTK